MRPEVKTRIRHKNPVCVKTVKQYQKEKRKNGKFVGKSEPRELDICDSTEGILFVSDDADSKGM